MLPNKKNLWATPNTLDHMPPRSKEAMERQFATTRKGRTKPSNLREQVHPDMWPTPRAAIGMHMKLTKNMAKLRHKKYLETEVAYKYWEEDAEKNEKPIGQLNPTWVEWLMGYGQGYTDPDNKDSFTLGSHQGFPTEPDTARVTTENQYRKDRLKALGNSIVPQIAYHIGNAILEQEKI